MLFGSSDAANAITVDKTPAALWVMDLSVRLFGLSSWSVLVPQALDGRWPRSRCCTPRCAGSAAPAAALLAGAVFALTPVAALMFRFNNPDALLVLLLVAARLLRAAAPCEPDASRWWLIAAGVPVGLRLPGQDAAGVPGAAGVRGGVSDRAAGVGADAGLRRPGSPPPRRWWSSGGLVAAARRAVARVGAAYIGGSQHDSILELALGYNGFGRLTGDEPGGLGNLNFDVGWDRLFGRRDGSADDRRWLLPAALICAGRGVSSHQAGDRAPTRPGRR